MTLITSTIYRIVRLQPYVYSCVLVFVSLTAFAGTCSTVIEPTSAATLKIDVMPETLEKVILDMSQANLIQARPSKLKPFMEGDNANYPKLLFEDGVRSPFFDTVIYGFSDDEPKLKSLILSKKVSRNEFSEFLHRFKTGVIRKWGVPTNILVENQSGVEYITILWSKKDIIITASYPSSHPDQPPSGNIFSFFVRIFSASEPENKIIKPAVSPKITTEIEAKNDIEAVVAISKASDDAFR